MKRITLGLALLCCTLLLVSSVTSASAFIWRRRPKVVRIFPGVRQLCLGLRNMTPAEGVNATFYRYYWVNKTVSDEFSFSWSGLRAGSEFTFDATVEISRKIIAFLVLVLYDPDYSLKPFIENETSPPSFTGDEVFTYTAIISAEVNGTATWTSPEENKTTEFHRTYVFFVIEQLHTRNVEIEENYVSVTADVLRHRLTALHVFKDQDGDQIMDIDVHQSYMQWEISGEALYRFRPISIESFQVELPHVEDHRLTWGLTAINIQGKLVPIGTSEHVSFCDGSTDEESIEETISEFAYTFHFTPEIQEVNGTQYYAATLKVDTYVGEWSNKSSLNDLSMALTYLTIEADYNRTAEHRALDEAGRECPGHQTPNRESRNLTFFTDDEPVGSVLFGGNTYVWNGTQEVNATSCITPLDLVSAEFECVTPALSWHLEVNATTHLYSCCYPLWSGYSIDHDPSFSMFAAEKGVFVDLKPAPLQRMRPVVLGLMVVAFAAVVIGSFVYIQRRRAIYSNNKS